MFKEKGKLWSFVLLCVLVVSPFNCCTSCAIADLINCSKDIIHQRKQPVEAMPLLDVEIPVNADLTVWEDWESLRVPPVGINGANIFLNRFDSIEQARFNFEYECNHGWHWNEDWNKYGQSGFTYGGNGNDRYCASYAIEWRYDATSLCTPSGEYLSFVVFQKGDVVISIHENEDHSVDSIGISTNEAIQELVDELSNATTTDD